MVSATIAVAFHGSSLAFPFGPGSCGQSLTPDGKVTS